MSDLVNKVAELLNAPVDLVQRSAEARAQASGVSVDDVLNSWAGGESIAVGGATAPKEEATVEEVQEEAPVAATVAIKQIKKSVSLINETMSIKTNSDTILPKWLNFSFVIIPLFILIGLISSSNTQECGERGMLDVDRKSQQAVNCDGSPYEGRGVAATNTINYLAIGQEVYAGAGAWIAHDNVGVEQSPCKHQESTWAEDDPRRIEGSQGEVQAPVRQHRRQVLL